MKIDKWNDECKATFNADRGAPVVTISTKEHNGKVLYIVKKVWTHAECTAPFKTLQEAVNYAG
jgi:hypothetical protein